MLMGEKRIKIQIYDTTILYTIIMKYHILVYQFFHMKREDSFNILLLKIMILIFHKWLQN